MLTQSVMTVVFVHREKITYGSFLTNGETEPKSLIWWGFIKCRSDDAFRNKRVKRGKPHK